MMPKRQRGRFQKWVSHTLLIAPWRFVAFLLRILYGFHVKGASNLPERGPFILGLNEYSPLGFLTSGYISAVMLKKFLNEQGDNAVSYMQEELWRSSYFRDALGEQTEGYRYALAPHAAGQLTLGLLSGYRVLRRGGIVVLNPEGDMPWEGRPLPTGGAMAWLGLHAAVPVVPALCSVSCYDIWPRCQLTPYLTGRLFIKVGKPFKLTEVPREDVTEEEIKQATARVAAEFDRVRYGPGGLDEWIGPPTQNGKPVPLLLLQLCRPRPAGDGHPPSLARIPLIRRGIAQTLWRCPICQTDDALVHERPFLRPQIVRCQACAARWQVRRISGRDFRLILVNGPPDLVGLDMALSTWYECMAREFRLSPLSVSGVDLLPGEQVYLEACDVPLLPYRPNPLFDGWTGREPPKKQTAGRRELADWKSLGNGRLLITSHRLLWAGAERELDFNWASVTAVYNWALNSLGIRYGTMMYRFGLGQENGLKWLTHTGTVARQAADRDGHTISISPF